MYTVESNLSIQQKVVRQFNESLNRLNQCFRGNCTKGEALKAARDVGIAALAAITALYIGKTTIKAAPKAYRYGLQKAEQAGQFISSAIEEPQTRVYQQQIPSALKTAPFKKGDIVEIKGDEDNLWYVEGVDLESGNARVSDEGKVKIIKIKDATRK